jgi:hypothetical protein
VIALLSTNFARSARGAKLTKELLVNRLELTELTRDIVFIVNRFDRTDGLACAAIYAFIRLDVEHASALVDAINWALLDA